MTTLHRLLEVSSAHLSPDERDELLPDMDGSGHRFIGPMSVYWYTDGATARAQALLCDDDGDPSWRAHWPTLAGVYDEALRLGAGALLVDPDVDVVDGLAQYD